MDKQTVDQILIQKLWKVNYSLVVTIPEDVVKKYNLKEGQRIGLHIPFKVQEKKKSR